MIYTCIISNMIVYLSKYEFNNKEKSLNIDIDHF